MPPDINSAISDAIVMTTPPDSWVASMAAMIGTNAPVAKAANDATAACIGLASVESSMPSSSRACAHWVFLWSCLATCIIGFSLSPRCLYIQASSSGSSSGVWLWSVFLWLCRSARVALWELTDTYSPAAIDNAPAIIPANPAVKIAAWFWLAASTEH